MRELEQEMVRKSRTTIALTRHTKENLEDFREYRRESVDEILQRLMQIAKKHTNTCEDDEIDQKLRMKLKSRLKEVSEGRVLSTEQLREKLRRNNGN